MLVNSPVVEYCNGSDGHSKAASTGYVRSGRVTPKVGSPVPSYEHRRTKSYRMSETRVEPATVTRRRPQTLHCTRKPAVDIPHKYAIHIHPLNNQASVDVYSYVPNGHSQNGSGSCPVVHEPKLEQLHVPSVRATRSVSPVPRVDSVDTAVVASPLQRKDSLLSSLSRVWRSDETSKRPVIRKVGTLDVPSQALLRQLSLSDSVVGDGVEPSATTAGASAAHLAPNSSLLQPTRRYTALTLSSKQRRLIKMSFNALNTGGNFLKLIEQIFRRMEAKSPDIRSIFLTTAFVNSLSRERSSPPLVKTEHDHCKCLVGMFEQIVENLEDLHRYVPLLRQYGQKHAQMAQSGFSGQMIEQFGEIAVAVIGSQEAIKYNQDCVKAWRLLIAFITDEMSVGYDKLAKINERRASAHNAAQYAQQTQQQQ